MGLFSFFNSKNKNADFSNENGADLPKVTEEIFISKDQSEEVHRESPSESGKIENGIKVLFQFLERDFERKGYDDALINPDITHLDQNTRALQNDLERTILKVTTFYQDFIREINVHISSRSRSGMVDTVEELTAKKETAESHAKQVNEIATQAKEGNGVGQSIIISYTRGFKNGLAAISHHSILNRNF